MLGEKFHKTIFNEKNPDVFVIKKALQKLQPIFVSEKEKKD